MFVKGGFAEVDADRVTVLAERALDVEALDAATISQSCRWPKPTCRRHWRCRQARSRFRRRAIEGAATLTCALRDRSPSSETAAYQKSGTKHGGSAAGCGAVVMCGWVALAAVHGRSGANVAMTSS